NKGNVDILWTARHYPEDGADTVAGRLYQVLIPYVLQHKGKVTHILRQGQLATDVLDTVLQIATRTKAFARYGSDYRCGLVQRTKIRELPTDFYTSSQSGAVIAFSRRLSAAPETGLYIPNEQASVIRDFTDFAEAHTTYSVKMFGLSGAKPSTEHV